MWMLLSLTVAVAVAPFGAVTGVVPDVGGLHPRRAKREVPFPWRDVEGIAKLPAAPASLDLAGFGPGLFQRLADGPAAVAVGDGDEGVGRGRVVGKAGPAQGDV